MLGKNNIKMSLMIIRVEDISYTFLISYTIRIFLLSFP